MSKRSSVKSFNKVMRKKLLKERLEEFVLLMGRAGLVFTLLYKVSEQFIVVAPFWRSVTEGWGMSKMVSGTALLFLEIGVLVVVGIYVKLEIYEKINISDKNLFRISKKEQRIRI